MYTKIAGTGSYVPKRIVTNEDMETLVETSDEWIRSRTGIESRHMINNGEEDTSDMAFKAALRAIEDADIDKHSIDLLIVATVTPDTVFPGVSQVLQRRLGIKPVMAFDVNAACSGFLYILNIADKMIKSGAYKQALIIGAEALSKITDFSDRNTCVLFGDAAGAMVITESETDKIKNVVSYAHGDTEGYLSLDNYPLKIDFKTPSTKRAFLKMNGIEVFKFATRVMPEVVNELLVASHVAKEDLKLIVAHQANKRIIENAAKTLKFPMDKMFINIDKYGNTSAASVPLAIDQAIKEKRLVKGDVFITAAFGGGLTWAGALIEL